MKSQSTAGGGRCGRTATKLDTRLRRQCRVASAAVRTVTHAAHDRRPAFIHRRDRWRKVGRLPPPCVPVRAHHTLHGVIRLQCISCSPAPRRLTLHHPPCSSYFTPLPPHIPLRLFEATPLAHHTDLRSMSPWRWLPRPQPSHLRTCHSLPCAMPPRAWRVGAQTTRHADLSRGSCERCAASAVTQRR